MNNTFILKKKTVLKCQCKGLKSLKSDLMENTAMYTH